MYYNLLDICDFQGGTQPPKDKWIKEYKDGYIRMLQIRDYSQSDDKFIEYVEDSNQLHKCKKDDIMLSRYGYIGQAFMGLEGAYNVALVKVIKKQDINTKYLYYYFKSNVFKHYLLSNVGARATIPGFNKSELKDAKINIKPLDEQIRIVKNLTICEEIISESNKEIENFDLLIKARFIEMFGDYLKDDRKPLSEVAIITGGLTKNSNRNTFETKMPYLRVANVFYNRLDLREILKIGVKEEEIEKTLLQAGDLLFVEGNGSIEQIGRVAIWDGSIDPILHQNHLIKVRFNNEIIAPEYALFYFMLQDGRQQIISKSVSTSGLNTLSVNKVSSLLLPITPIALQKQFSVFVKQVDKSRFDIKKSIIELEREVVYD